MTNHWLEEIMEVTTNSIKQPTRLLSAIKPQLKGHKISQMVSAPIEDSRKFTATFMMILWHDYSKIGKETQLDPFLLKKTFHSQETQISSNIRPKNSTNPHTI